MDNFIIHGEKPLKGEVSLRGSKNAATPILAATLLTNQPCIIDNLPLIEDVYRMLEILESLGSKITWLGKRKIQIQTKEIDVHHMKEAIVRKLRSSILLLGPLLAHVGKFDFPTPGGCIIGARPLDTHFDAFRNIGVKIKTKDEKYSFEFLHKKYQDRQIILREFSVTATENILMLASALPQETKISLAASEPHIQDLAIFLKKMGASIEGIGTHHLVVRGKKRLNGARHHLVSDYLEAGTFLIASAATKGKVLVKRARPDHLESVLSKLKEMGVRISIQSTYQDQTADILVLPSLTLKAARIQTLPYPGLPTDLQALFGVLATQAIGTSLVHDALYEGRLRYVLELNKMGANCLLADAHRAFIVGPTPLYGKRITSFDIRAGATLIIAGLIAKGKTVIDNIYQVDRGYEKIEERLQKLGADIKRVRDEKG